MIFYQIQAAYNLSFLPELLQFIYSKDNFYLITIDKHRAAEASIIRGQFENIRNVQVDSDLNITWGGLSQVDAMLRGMRTMVEAKRRYQYFINLSDHDIPLWTNAKVSSFLTQAETENKLGFIFHWRPEIDFDALTLEEDAGASIFGHRTDVRFSVENSIQSYFKDFSDSPIQKTLLRPLFVCSEQPAQKLIHVRPMLPFEKTVRKTFFELNPIYVGRQWLILHDSLIRSVLSSPQFEAFYRVCGSTFIPDEMFFQTILVNLQSDVLVNDNLRFRAATPTTLTDADLAEMEDCQAAFARKIDLGNSTNILERARSMFRDSIVEFNSVMSSDGPIRTDGIVPEQNYVDFSERIEASPVTAELLNVENRSFRFSRGDGSEIARELILLPGGEVGGYFNRNEHRWTLHGGYLAFLNDAGRITTFFHEQHLNPTGYRFVGRYLGDGTDSGSRPHILQELSGDQKRLGSARLPGKRNNLVVLRAGPSSLHPTWLQEPSHRNWDLLISPYQPLASAWPEVTIDEVVAGPKWIGIQSILAKDRVGDIDWRTYKYIWIPDDDLFISQNDINRLFDMSAELDTKLSAPALHEKSFCCHSITMVNTAFAARKTNFVELMMPCFRADVLTALLDTIGLTKTGYGWGLDLLWCKRLEFDGIYIVDAVRALHTRPSHGSPAAAQQELADLMRDADLHWDFRVFGGYDSDLAFISDTDPQFLLKLLAGSEHTYRNVPGLLPSFIEQAGYRKA